MKALICSSSPPSNLLLLSHLFLHLIHCLVFLLPLLFLLNFLPSACPPWPLSSYSRPPPFSFLSSAAFISSSFHLLPLSTSLPLPSTVLFSFSSSTSCPFPPDSLPPSPPLPTSSPPYSSPPLHPRFPLCPCPSPHYPPAHSSVSSFCFLHKFKLTVSLLIYLNDLIPDPPFSLAPVTVFLTLSSCWICFVVESCLTLRKLLFDQENNFNSDSLTQFWSHVSSHHTGLLHVWIFMCS